jgi:KaiC/GvpD/RAD55 family RecA-like ATPase
MTQAVAAGLAAGDRVMVFTASLQPLAVLAGVQERGVRVGPAYRAGRVQVLPAQQAYLPAGRFEPVRLLDSLVGHVEQATADGYPGLRLVGDMAWALRSPAGIDQLAEYEARVNQGRRSCVSAAPATRTGYGWPAKQICRPRRLWPWR